MVDTIRLGLIGASVSGTWSARSHLPAVQPTFETAVDLHRLIDAVRRSSDSGCEVIFGQTTP
jgi:hypothetical protein